MSRQPKHFYEFGPFRIDLADRLLLRDGEIVPLKRKAFETLLLLVEHHGQVLEKDELMQRLWPDSFVEEANLTQNIYIIRKALGEGTNNPQYIVTVPGRGYRFTAEVREWTDEPEEEIVVERRTVSRVVISQDVTNREGAAEAIAAATGNGASAALPPAEGPKLLTGAVNPSRSRFALPLGLSLVALLAIGFGLYQWRKTATASLPVPPPRVKPLTSFPGSESQPAFSPDGKQIAFVWDDDAANNPDIYIKLIDTGPPLRLTTDPANDHAPAWSPDGRQIAFLRQKGEVEEILLISALGGPERSLGQVSRGQGWTSYRPTALNWSPDGQWLAVMDSPGGKNSIFLLSTETGEKRRVTTPPLQVFGDSYPVFSPDGQTLAFIRGVNSGIEEIYLVPATGGGERPLVANGGPVLGLAWARDGQSVLFSANRSGDRGLWRVAVTGGEPEPVLAGNSEAAEFSIARQGSTLAYTQRNSDTNIYRVELTGAAAGPASKGGSMTRWIASSRQDTSPQISPDGNRIAFASDRSGTWEIWVSDSDSKHPVQLTSFNGPTTGSPRWSPDGQQIAFDSRIEDQAEIYIISARGGKPRRLTEHPASDVVPSWSRDGRWVYFCSTRSGERQVWRMPAEGGAAVQVTRQGGFEGFESPDRKFFYYARRSQDGIFRIPVEGGEEAPVPELANAGYHRNWYANDTGIYFIPRPTTPHPVISFFSFATGQIGPVVTLADARLAEATVTVGPGAKWFLYAHLDENVSDIVLVENYR